MIDDLRRMREHCEPKSNQNPLYLRYSNAVSVLKWIIEDLASDSQLEDQGRARRDNPQSTRLHVAPPA